MFLSCKNSRAVKGGLPWKAASFWPKANSLLKLKAVILVLASAPTAGVLPSGLSEHWGSVDSTAHQTVSGGIGLQTLFPSCFHKAADKQTPFLYWCNPWQDSMSLSPFRTWLRWADLPLISQWSSFISTPFQVTAKEADLCQWSQGASFPLRWPVCNLTAWRAFCWAWSRCPKWGLKWKKLVRSLGQIASKANHFQRKSTSCNYLCNNFKHKADESKNTKIIPSNDIV